MDGLSKDHGVCCDATKAGQFRYLAGVEATGLTEGGDQSTFLQVAMSFSSIVAKLPIR